MLADTRAPVPRRPCHECYGRIFGTISLAPPTVVTGVDTSSCAGAASLATNPERGPLARPDCTRAAGLSCGRGRRAPSPLGRLGLAGCLEHCRTGTRWAHLGTAAHAGTCSTGCPGDRVGFVALHARQ